MRDTVADRISELSADLDSQLKRKVDSFLLVSVALDENIDIGDVAHLARFILGVDKTWTIETKRCKDVKKLYQSM